MSFLYCYHGGMKAMGMCLKEILIGVADDRTVGIVSLLYRLMFS